MKILAFSDIHRDLDACARLVEAAAEADLVIGCGDFASARKGLGPVMEALRPIADKAVYVPGNNESLQELDAALGGTGAALLHGTAIERGGLTILGLGGAIPPLPPIPWPSWDVSEAAADELLERFESADILALHSPPKGVGDELPSGHVGSVVIRNAIRRLQPRLALCGHVHESWGARGQIGDTLVANLGPTVNWFEL